MYQNRFVTAVKHNGRVLREQGETVFLPFGCEFTLMFKNLNSVRALVRVSIDGTDATEGTSLIVPPNQSIDLERFIVAGNLSAGHRFKFIERTKKIEDGPRGIKAEDGLIRVEFEFERLVPSRFTGYLPGQTLPWHDLQNEKWRLSSAGGMPKATYSAPAKIDGVTLCSTASAFRGAETSAVAANASFSNTTGITVAGSESHQQFTAGQWFPTDGVKHVMVLRLLGEVNETRVSAPVTVKTKTDCPTCGTKNKFGTKFCRECGTALTIL